MLLGNYLGDFVTKTHKQQLSEPILNGIELHYAIDNFTDKHPKVLDLNASMKADFGRYAAVLVDIYFDHFLALHWSNYYNKPLPLFSESSLNVLFQNSDLMPPKALRFLHYLQQYQALVNYREIEGIKQVLNGMSRRATFESNMENGHVYLLNEFEKIQEVFFTFFEDLQSFVQQINPHFSYAK